MVVVAVVVVVPAAAATEQHEELIAEGSQELAQEMRSFVAFAFVIRL